MNPASAVLQSIATEIAEYAKKSLPVLREGETVESEWLENGTFYRKTNLNGTVYLSQYDFRQRKSCRKAVTK